MSRLAAVVLLLLVVAPVEAAWIPPIGIPDPGFGINDVIPARTHYVDNSVTCDDTNNGGLGSPAAPRCTIPTTLAAGASVEVHGGPYIYLTSCSNAFVASGTSGARVYVWGVASGGNKPVIKGDNLSSGSCFQTKGSYYVVDGFRFSAGTRMSVLLGGDHGSFRNNECVNYQPEPDAQGRQFGACVGDAYETIAGHVSGQSNIVIYNNVFSDNGNYRSLPDNKVQGIKFSGGTTLAGDYDGSAGANNIWIVDNTFFHNGQAMQHGDDCIGTIVLGACQAKLSSFPHHFYIGRNVMHDDREVGLALKMIRDVVVSQNTVYNYIDLPAGANCATSPTITALNIGRFATDNVWVLFNRVYNTSMAIRSNGQLEAQTGPDIINPKVYIIGNVITDVRTTSGATGANCNPYSATDPYSSGVAIIGWDNYQASVVDNTIANADKGITFQSNGAITLSGNLLSNVGDPEVFVNTNLGTTNANYSFYDGTARLAYGGGPTPIISLATMQTNGQELNGLQGNALLDANFKPTTGSPAINASVQSAVYATFATLYGLTITKDYNGLSRPQQGVWDIGAYEAGAPRVRTTGRVTISGGVSMP